MFYRNSRQCCCMNNQYTNNCDNMENENSVIDQSCNSCNCLNSDYISGCECGFDDYNVFPDNPVLGQSYVPMQRMDKVFKKCIGLKMGTLFPELVSPYSPCQSMQENAYIARTNSIGKGCNKCQ